MRKALIAVIVASALFAIGALAAEFALTAEDTASGADAVDACSDTVLVEFDEIFDGGDGESNVWLVDEVDLTIDAVHTCAGAQISIILQDADDNTVDTITGVFPVSGNTHSLEPTGELPVSSVWRASVLFDGQNVAQT